MHVKTRNAWITFAHDLCSICSYQPDLATDVAQATPVVQNGHRTFRCCAVSTLAAELLWRLPCVLCQLRHVSAAGEPSI